MSEPVRSEPFHALVLALREAGFVANSQRLDDSLNGTWTTSTELIGELGVEVIAIRKECKPLNPTVKRLLKECLREVRKAWPGFGFFSWLPFR